MSQHEGGDKMFQRLFAPRPAVLAGRALYGPLIAQARQPAFYQAGEVADSSEGRFELYTLHLALVLRRLRGQGEAAAEVSQSLFDAFISGLDDGLREMGVGDLSVGKKMRKLGEALYGRLKAYDAALAPGADPLELEALLGRTIYAGREGAPTRSLAAYVRAADQALQTAPLAAIMENRIAWVEVRL